MCFPQSFPASAPLLKSLLGNHKEVFLDVQKTSFGYSQRLSDAHKKFSDAHKIFSLFRILTRSFSLSDVFSFRMLTEIFPLSDTHKKFFLCIRLSSSH